MPNSQQLIDALRNPARYPHAADSVELIETHISWVLLAGDYAWKIKKPVDLGFVDFTTLERRRFFCEEEIRLNRRLAPELYLAAVPITGTPDAPTIGGTGQPIEYAVQMRRFSQTALLSRVLDRGQLTASHIDGLAAEIADFHHRIARAANDSPCGRPEQLQQPVRENFDHIAPLEHDPAVAGRIERLRQWSEEEFTRRRDDFAARKQNGFIRECHGDMHLGNMILQADRVLIFDGIEFNDDLRWIDVLSEIAFVIMDLADRRRPDLAHRLLNAYLERTGDYAGLPVLSYYLCYRAMVRAKVACIRGHQPGLSEAEQQQCRDQFHSYLQLAEQYTQPRPPCLVITHGVSGSGKTYGTQPLIEQLGFLRLRSDVERKRLFGIAPLDRVPANQVGALYSTEMTQQTFNHLAELAETLLRAGVPVIVDATFLKRNLRHRFRTLAQRLAVPFAIAAFKAPDDVLRQRIQHRATKQHDASDADLQVLNQQLAARQPFSAEEQRHVIEVDSEDATAKSQLIEAVRERMSQ